LQQAQVSPRTKKEKKQPAGQSKAELVRQAKAKKAAATTETKAKAKKEGEGEEAARPKSPKKSRAPDKTSVRRCVPAEHARCLPARTLTLVNAAP
jgi:hypothetical protein